MRFLGIGDYCDLGALYLRLIAEGHEVKVHVAKPLCHGILAGLVCILRTGESSWTGFACGGERNYPVRKCRRTSGQLQDELRRDGFHVIGGSAYGDRLENDRAYAQAVLKELGLSICPVHN